MRVLAASLQRGRRSRLRVAVAGWILPWRKSAQDTAPLRMPVLQRKTEAQRGALSTAPRLICRCLLNAFSQPSAPCPAVIAQLTSKAIFRDAQCFHSALVPRLPPHPMVCPPLRVQRAPGSRGGVRPRLSSAHNSPRLPLPWGEGPSLPAAQRPCMTSLPWSPPSLPYLPPPCSAVVTWAYLTSSKIPGMGTSLVVQWLRLGASTARGHRFDPWLGN